MNPAMLRRTLAVLTVLTVVAAVPSFAAKRRAVAHRPPGVHVSTPLINGVVLDSVTGQPVRALAVTAGLRSAGTDAQGRFELRNVSEIDAFVVLTERSGYLNSSTRVGANDPKELTIRVTPTPTVTVKRANGQSLNVDFESFKFGYPVPFSGYRDSEFEDFCKSDGTKVRIERSQLKRVAGPAVIATAGPCCEAGNAARMAVTLRTGETSDLFFTDTCQERYVVDVGARDHVTGAFLHIPITDISEIVFP